MRPFIAALAALIAGSTLALAQDWQRLDDAQITQTLEGQTLDYGGAWQVFRADGRTLYNAGRDSWGYWRVQNGQYCSQWPPRSEWACYWFDQAGDHYRFVDAQGHETRGRLRAN